MCKRCATKIVRKRSGHSSRNVMCQFTDAGESCGVSTSTRARKRALVVGISDYTNVQKLDFCRNDGKEVYDVLTSLGYEISDE